MYDPRQTNGNENDPLLPKRSDNGRELFNQIALAAAGFQHDDVVNAAVNLIVNAVRQTNPTKREAEATFEKLMAQTKALLLDCHYGANGKRKSIFPFHQTLGVPFFDNENDIPGS